MWKKRKKTGQAPICDLSGRIRHVAFIMDGNGRWATRRGLPREMGHARGAETFRRIVGYCRDLGIGTVTVYAFSTENWSRPRAEVEALMKHLDRFMEEELALLEERQTKIVFLGDKTALAPSLRQKAEEIEKRSASMPRCLNIALNYGGRAEIVHACNTLLREGYREVDEATFASHLYTAGSPDPDLVIRTGGDLRISNFLLYQSAYSEYWFTPTLWPDLSEREVYGALMNFCGRRRRFGGLDPAEAGEKKEAE